MRCALSSSACRCIEFKTRGFALMKLHPLSLFLTLWIVLGHSAALHADTHDQWPRFRGSNGAGYASTEVLPSSWTNDEWTWQADMPGIGHSSPIIWDGKVFLTSANEEQKVRHLLCHELHTGKLLWQQDFPGNIERHHKQNSSASGSVTVNSDGIYWLWGTSQNVRLEALTHDGTRRWGIDLGPFIGHHGFGSSPVIWKNTLIVPLEQDTEGTVVGIDTKTGKTRWRLARDGADKAAYSTPLVLAHTGSEAQVICTSKAHGLYAINPQTGTVLWENKCFPLRTVGSPVCAGNLLIGTCGSGGGGSNLLVALKPPATKDDASEIVYEIPRSTAPYVPTPLFSNGRLYLWGDKGVVTCIHAARGDIIWKERVGGNFSSSPILIGDEILNISSDGEMVTLVDGEEFQVLGRREVDEECRATPAVAEGFLVIRTQSSLFCLKISKL